MKSSSKIIYERSHQKSNSIPIVCKQNNSKQITTDYFSPDPISHSPPNKFITKLYSRMSLFSSSADTFAKSNNLVKV